MNARKLFNQHFQKNEIVDIYQSRVILSGAVGIDNLSHAAFQKQLDEHMEIISRKCIVGTYEFTKYKLKLISKGRGKAPRELAIPTIRDRIVHRAICLFLLDHYKELVNLPLPQEMVKQVKSEVSSKVYTHVIKLDASNFYPSIKHGEMLRRLRSRIRDPDIIRLIEKAISTPTVIRSHKTDSAMTCGIPQGLSISNILAAIYMINIDKYLSSYSNIAYFRYVDDVLILCNESDVRSLTTEVVRRFRRLGLKIHDPEDASDKSTIGRINKGFDYLGYCYRVKKVKGFYSPLYTVRHGSIEKLKESLVSIFTGYKYSRFKSEDFLAWRLNMRITGCIFQNKSKGWLFFFSEINDTSLLKKLDRHVEHLIDRFGVGIKPKLFLRSYHEIKYRRKTSNYIPNFDEYTYDDMREVLTKYFRRRNVFRLSDEAVEIEFKKKIDRQTRELLTDIADFS